MITNEVAFVAIAVSDKERARKFYQETLELKPTRTQMDGAWVEYDLGPTTIGVGSHPAWQPSRDGTTVAFEVEDFDSAYEKLKERGVNFDIEKMETPVCWMAQFRDPDGNKLVIHKRKLPEKSRQMIKEIAFTGSSVTDMKRARAFYEDVLGLKPSEEMAGGKWIEYEVGGGIFAITNIDPKWTPSNQGTAIAFEVDDMDATIEKLKKSEVQFFLDKSETPVCWMAIVYDPDGNKVVIHKRKQ